MTAAAGHLPVLLHRVTGLLGPALHDDGAVLLDCTVGLGGHAAALLAEHPGARLVGLDRDPSALRRAAATLADPASAGRVELVRARFDELASVLDRLGRDRVDAVLFDLGVSSPQLDEVARGFSYAHDAPLDMRMDPSSGRSAADVLNTYTVSDLTRVLTDYGEERFARRIAGEIDRARRRAPLRTTAELVECVYRAVPAPARRRGGHPAKRTFQALRIEVNGELDAVRVALPDALAALRVGGRVAVLAYHSLEDRIVKRALAAGARPPVPPDLPVEPPQARPWLRLLTRGAEGAAETEVAANPRAGSVRLRAAEKLREVA